MPKPRLDITLSDRRTLSVSPDDIVKGKGKASIYCYIDRCEFSFNEAPYKSFRKLEKGNEIKVVMTDPATGLETAIFHGSLDLIRVDFDKTKGIETVTVTGSSFAKELAESELNQYEKHFENGYGQVVKDLVQGKAFEVNRVQDDEAKGNVYFDKISILDAIRTLAYAKGWCLGFEGRSVIFEPCQQPRHSGVVLSDQDIQSGTFVK